MLFCKDALTKGFQWPILSQTGKNARAFEQKIAHQGDPMAHIEPSLQKIDSLAVEKQINQVKKLKNKRDNQSVKNKIKSLESCALTNNNLIPKIIEAAKAECTLGEIADALRKSFGEHNQV